MISVKELEFVKAHEEFQRMCEFLEQALSEGQRVDQVERGLFPRAMTMCLDLLRSFVVAHGDGDEGGYAPTRRRDAPTSEGPPREALLVDFRGTAHQPDGLRDSGRAGN